MIAGMPEVMELTRAGRLMEATAAIQSMLGGRPFAPTGSESVKGARAPIEGVFRVVDEEPSRTTQALPNPTAPRSRPVPRRAPADVPAGQFLTGSYTNYAGTRSYKVYIPSGYREQPLPLIVMLHGCTQGPDDFAAGTRMNQLAEEQRCLVLYPAQAQGANISKCWNWFKESEQCRDKGEPCIVAGMTREIMRTYHVDPQRIYAAGLSAGGAMAVIMGMTYPDLYAAIGVHSGLAYAAAHDLPSAFAAMRAGKTNGRLGIEAVRAPGIAEGVVPTIVFHGDRDATVHPQNGEQVIAQSRTAAASGRAETTDSRSRVSVERGQVAKGHAYTRTVYHDDSGRSIVEHWLVHGAGHAWSGGSSSGSFTDPKGPDATEAMARFFLEHPKSALH